MALREHRRAWKYITFLFQFNPICNHFVLPRDVMRLFGKMACRCLGVSTVHARRAGPACGSARAIGGHTPV